MTVREAGRELDQRIAIEVMGWGWMRATTPQVLPVKRWLVPPEEYGEWGDVRTADMSEPPEHFWWLCEKTTTLPSGHVRVPDYSTDIAAAWQVVDQMMDKRGAFGVWLAQTHESLPYCQFQIDKAMHSGEGTSFPHAICLAALATVGSPVSDRTEGGGNE